MNVGFFMKAVMRSVWLLSGVGVFWACQHAMPLMQQAPPANLQATLSSIQANIFTPKCVNAGCHPGTGGGPMSLRAGDSFGTLVGVNSISYGRPRVAPGNANNSVLYLKVTGNNTVGGRMPALGAPLSQTETDSIAAWINRGALNN
jgi:hypothetical protein